MSDDFAYLMWLVSWYKYHSTLFFNLPYKWIKQSLEDIHISYPYENWHVNFWFARFYWSVRWVWVLLARRRIYLKKIVSAKHCIRQQKKKFGRKEILRISQHVNQFIIWFDFVLTKVAVVHYYIRIKHW